MECLDLNSLTNEFPCADFLDLASISDPTSVSIETLSAWFDESHLERLTDSETSPNTASAAQPATIDPQLLLASTENESESNSIYNDEDANTVPASEISDQRQNLYLFETIASYLSHPGGTDASILTQQAPSHQPSTRQESTRQAPVELNVGQDPSTGDNTQTHPIRSDSTESIIVSATPSRISQTLDKGPPRKRRQTRKKQFELATVSYSDLMSSVVRPSNPIPSSQVPQNQMFQPTFLPTSPTTARDSFSIDDNHLRNTLVPPTVTACNIPCWKPLKALVPQTVNGVIRVPCVPEDTYIHYERCPYLNASMMELCMNPTQGPTQNVSANHPQITNPNVRPPARQSWQSHQAFIFAENNVPKNFIPNPNNHGRWSIDKQGQRHYLNAPKNKRPITEVT